MKADDVGSHPRDDEECETAENVTFERGSPQISPFRNNSIQERIEK